MPSAPPPSGLVSDGSATLPTDTTYQGVQVTGLTLVPIYEDGSETTLAPLSALPKLTLTGDDTFDLASIPNLAPATTARTPAPVNLAIAGTTQLWSAIPAKLYIYEHWEARLFPYHEVAVLSRSSLSLGDVVPDLKGSPLDSLILRGTRYGYVRRTYDYTRHAGMYLDTELEFSVALQPVADFLRNVFKQDQPGIRFTAFLGDHHDWNDLRAYGAIGLRGSLEGLSLKLFDDVLEFKTIGVEVYANQRANLATGSYEWDVGYGLFGDVLMTVPGSIVPLQVKYEIARELGEWEIALKLREVVWKDCFGVQGLALNEVNLLAILTGANSPDSVIFELSAGLALSNTAVTVRGTYSREAYELSGVIGDFSLEELGALFQQLFGIELEALDHDIRFHSVGLLVSTAGLTLYGGITIIEHTASTGLISFSSDGVAIQGKLGDIRFEDITIREASFDVFIACKGVEPSKARSSRCALKGAVSYEQLLVQVAVDLDKSADGHILWTVFGQLDGYITTSSLVPGLRDSFLDISLAQLALIASNRDAPTGRLALPYLERKGFQICAVIDRIPQLEQLLGGSLQGTVFRLRIDLGSESVELGLTLSSARTIAFNPTVRTGPVELAIHVGTTPADIVIRIGAQLSITLPTQPQDLKFALAIEASAFGMRAFGQMTSDWCNPCGVGEEVIVRNCTVDIGILYATFLETGPSEIGLGGEVTIGTIVFKGMMKISQDPKDELFVLDIVDLGLDDLLAFASIVSGVALPQAGDVLHIARVVMYFSTGVTLGLASYPMGVSAKGAMTVFGKPASIDMVVDSGVKIVGTVERFQLGPLVVRGTAWATTDPILKVELLAATQNILIDGEVDIWNTSTSFHLAADLLPVPKLQLLIQLRLSDALFVHLEVVLDRVAELKTLNLDALANIDLNVYALVEQHIVRSVVDMLSEQITMARKVQEEGYEQTKGQLEAAQDQWKASIDSAAAEVAVARQAWEAKKATVEGSLVLAKAALESTRIDLRGKLDVAITSYNAALQSAKDDLEQAQHNAAAAEAEAQRQVAQAEVDGNARILTAQADLDAASARMRSEFGDADRSLEDAKRQVDEAQRRVDELQAQIDDLDRQIEHAGFLDKIQLNFQQKGLQAAKLGATGALVSANGVLSVAQMTVNGPGYQAAKGSMDLAAGTLQGAKDSKTFALEKANGSLELVKEQQAARVADARSALDMVRDVGQERVLRDAAQAAFDAGMAAPQQTVDSARSAVGALDICIEKGAFDTATNALKLAQDKTNAVNLARHALDVVQAAEDVELDIVKWVGSHAGLLVDINTMEFSGTLQCLTSNDARPLRVAVEAVIMGQKDSPSFEWKPESDLVGFVKDLFGTVWDRLHQLGPA